MVKGNESFAHRFHSRRWMEITCFTPKYRPLAFVFEDLVLDLATFKYIFDIPRDKSVIDCDGCKNL